MSLWYSASSFIRSYCIIVLGALFIMLVICVRVYLVGYIFCIIDCHICRDIFDRIDIMYYRLSYVSRGVLPHKTLVLYIYRLRGTMQYSQQLYVIYSSYMVSD
jgi:uncharacterized membrane protein